MEIVFFTVAFLAEAIGTIAGFGSSTIMLPVALLFFDFETALVLVALMHLFGNLSRAAFFRGKIAWRIFAYFGVMGIVGTLAGALLVPHIDQGLLKAALGVFLVFYSIFAWVKPAFSMKPRKINMIAGGAISGFLAGIIGTGGALRSVFLTAYRLPKTEYIGTAAVIAIGVDGTRIPVYINDGLLKGEYLWMLPILFALAIAGAYVGKRLVGKIPQSVFKKIVLICLVAAGVKLFMDYILR